MGEVGTLLDAMWGLKISKGRVANMGEQASTDLAAPSAEAHAALKVTGRAGVTES
jgi:hypothetical protein